MAAMTMTIGVLPVVDRREDKDMIPLTITTMGSTMAGVPPVIVRGGNNVAVAVVEVAVVVDEAGVEVVAAVVEGEEISNKKAGVATETLEKETQIRVMIHRQTHALST